VLNGGCSEQAPRCVLGKAAQIKPDELVKLIQSGSAAQNAYGQKLGRQCRSALSST